MHDLWCSRRCSMSQGETKRYIWVVSRLFSSIPKCSLFGRHMYYISCKALWIICKPKDVVSYACIMHFEDHDQAIPGCHLQQHILSVIIIHGNGESFHNLTTTPSLLTFLDTSIEKEKIEKQYKSRLILELSKSFILSAKLFHIFNRPGVGRAVL